MVKYSGNRVCEICNVLIDMRSISNRCSKCVAIGKYRDKSRAWKGNKAKYGARHLWIIHHYGKACMCWNHECKAINIKRYDWANISGHYRRDINDWIMLCRSCHNFFDRPNHCRRGHKYTKESTLIVTLNGGRECKICKKITRELRRSNARKTIHSS
jgi:hypothetical protein